tara:strand:+ start:3324 stop:4379 length:1056 start_codon:yes stop_codon:yes gene_type:complete
MRILSVVGARPQFVKLAPVDRALTEIGLEHLIVHTGQHYDSKLSDIFFDEFKIPDPVANLGIGSHSHAVQTAKIIERLEPHIIEHKPDWVLAYGDTNSTLACAVVCSKLPYKMAHIEAGLRSNNRAMPEEHNRILTDHCSDLLLAPTINAITNLQDEGLGHRSHLVGDVMIDVLNTVKESITKSSFNSHQGIQHDGKFYLATIHRQENTDDEERLRKIIDSLAELNLPTYIPSHPRLIKRCQDLNIRLDRGSLRSTDPLSYRELIATIMQADHVITDSGGLQKEAFHLRTLCTTVRPETEWVETLTGEWNRLVEPEHIAASVSRTRPNNKPGYPFGDGDAAKDIANLLMDF